MWQFPMSLRGDEEQKTVEEAISGDEEPLAVETSLRLAKGKMKTVSC